MPACRLLALVMAAPLGHLVWGAYVGQNVSAATEQTSATAQEAAAAAQEPAHAAEGLQQVIARFRVSADA